MSQTSLLETLPKMKHTIMGHDEVDKQQDKNVASNDTTNKQDNIYDGDDDDDDDKSLTETHFSRQHMDEILGVQKHNQKTHGKKAEPELPQPQNIVEWIILWVYRLQRTTTKQYRPSGYWRYAIGVYQNLFLMFYFNWITIFTSPLSAFAFIFTYPIIAVALFMFEIGLKIFMDGLGGNGLVNCISKDFGYGFSIINWGAPQLLLSKKSRLLVRNTLPALGKTASESNSIETEDDQRHRTFDVSIAQTMTILGSLVYERQDKNIVEAYRMLSDFNKNKKNIKEADKQYQQIERDMTRLVWESERVIRKIARSYGLHFAGVTDLKSLGDTFCGLFWPIRHENPFIIVAFKGTTPTNYSEFLVDATLQRTDARSYLFGSAHEGFYSSLFSSHFDVDTRDPYYAIQSAIRERAAQLQKDSKDPSRPVQVWVAGHSLGAAIGSLLFARWLKCPEDIAPMCELRDAYVIGTPAVGDNDFASMFSSFSNLPLSRASTLWRVINKSDIICRIPPGYNSMTIGHYVSSTDFFNYSHIGHAVQITYPMLHEKPLKIYPSSYQSNLTVDIATSSDHFIPEEPPLANRTQEVDVQSYPWWFRHILKGSRNPISLLESFYPFFLRDHIPIHYFEGLERAQVYYSQQND